MCVRVCDGVGTGAFRRKPMQRWRGGVCRSLSEARKVGNPRQVRDVVQDRLWTVFGDCWAF